MAILLTSLSFLFLAFSLGQITRIDISPSVAVTALDVVATLFIIGWGIYFFLKKKWNLPKAWKSIVLFVVIAFLSLVFHEASLPNIQLIIAFLYLLRLVAYMGFFFLFYSFDEREKLLLKRVMVGAGMLLLAIGFVQFIFYPNLRNLLYAGWDEHLYRMFSSFFDPNFFGLFLAVYALFVFSQFLSSHTLGKRIFYILTAFVSMSALFLTYSRSALLALFVGGVSFLLIKGNKKVIVLFLLVFLIGGFIIFATTGKRSEGTNLLRIVSTDARFQTTQETFSIWQKNLLLGVGFDAYRYAQHTNGFANGAWLESHAGAGADNSFLFVGATTGVIGLAAFFALFSEHMFVLFKQKDKVKTSLGIATILSLSVGSFFINGLFYPSLLLWLWTILALTEST